MADQSDSLIRELNQELRREQLLKLWNQYGTFVVAAVAALLVGVGGYKLYEARAIDTAQRAGGAYASAATLAEQGKSDDALKAFSDIAKDGPKGYAALARMRVAAAAAKDGKTDDAVAAYDQLARDAADPLLADYARLQAAILKLATADWTETQNRLNDLMTESSPWRSSAREVLALAAIKAGKPEEARRVLEPLFGDRNVPPSIQERARILMDQVIAVERAAAPGTAAGNAAKEPIETPVKK